MESRLWLRLGGVLVAGMLALHVWSCGVGTRIDGTFSPADGATDVALDAAVTVVFTAAIAEPDDWLSKFSLTAAGSTANACTSVTYDAATLTATCVHAAFTPATVYTGTATGIIGYPVTSSFTTVSSMPALKLVRLDSTELALTSTAIPRAVTLKATFNQALTADEQAAIEQYSYLKLGGASIGLTYTWSSDATSFIATPARWLEYDKTYTVGIGTSASTVAETTFRTALINDFNGDGYADLIANAFAYPAGAGQGRVYIFFGSASGVADVDLSTGGTADVTLTGIDRSAEEPPGVDKFGISSSSADVNADGYADLVVGAPGGSETSEFKDFPGHVSIFLGGPSFSGSIGAEQADATVAGPEKGELGFSVSTAGDVNGDGYDDIVAGAPWEEGPTQGEAGAAFVLLGSATGIASCDIQTTPTCPNATVSGPDIHEAQLGVSVSTAGDVNGDGYDDVAVGIPGTGPSGDTGSVIILLGSAGGIADCDLSAETPCVPDTTITGSAEGAILSSVRFAGDINGDGYGDIVASEGYQSGGAVPATAYIFIGSAGGIANCDLGGVCPSPPEAIVGPDDPASFFASSAGGIGDVNGDGYDDIAIGMPQITGMDPFTFNSGEVFVFTGSASGIASCSFFVSPSTCSPETTVTGKVESGLGAPGWPGGDVNGDGFADLRMGAMNAAGGKGEAYVILGRESGIADCNLSSCTPDTTIVGAEANDYFGCSMAGGSFSAGAALSMAFAAASALFLAVSRRKKTRIRQ